ncbi:MAG: hypothetical protein QOF25_4887, partial [Mycobacterium sp.]|nr:hypothetical protein [Mycobacterium sp.]
MTSSNRARGFAIAGALLVAATMTACG